MSYSIEVFTATSGSPADGKEMNSFTATIVNGTTYADNVEITATLTGNALFASNKTNKVSLITNNQGVINEQFYDSTAETVDVHIELATDKSVSATTSSVFIPVNAVVEKLLLIITRDDALADGVSENELLIQTVTTDGIPVPSTPVVISLSGGAQFVEGKEASLEITTSDDDGTASLAFTNTNSGTTKVVAYVKGKLSIEEEADATFKEVKPILNTVLKVIANNAIANGQAFNQVEATVTSQETSNPVSGISVTFHVDGNAATFSDGATNFTTITDGDGKAYARLISKQPEDSDTVTAETYTGRSNSVFIDFQEDYPDLSIVRVFNLIKTFSGTGPTVAWPDATFYVQVAGGSGDYKWSSNSSSDLIYEASGEHSDEAAFTFSSNATHDKEYTITVQDIKTNNISSISFSLEAFFTTFGTWKQYDWLTPSEYPSLGELTALFAEWGDMSKYNGWLIPGGKHYWSNTEVLGFAEAVNLVDGKIHTFSILSLCGVAIKKK
ncbi:Ig-like domain-containing protein [Pantoea sp. BAV 3049]|uniref:Ig-like domain-containing protein n=1 Tax=Pantoea sp. BAV 3049 TaxID=2654188 RepID=UPI00131C3086|nr:Ig-like domain-containing protein [Pantoea sp. BAV 3049]